MREKGAVWAEVSVENDDEITLRVLKPILDIAGFFHLPAIGAANIAKAQFPRDRSCGTAIGIVQDVNTHVIGRIVQLRNAFPGVAQDIDRLATYRQEHVNGWILIRGAIALDELTVSAQVVFFIV